VVDRCLFRSTQGYEKAYRATLGLGKGSVFSMSTKQKINTKSSTESELVGVDDGMPMVIWTRRFLEEQGYVVTDNVIYQDNQSAILLERNGRASSGRRTRHIDIRYFFASDKIAQGDIRVEYCPTENMIADFFTKPLQGSLFKRFRALIMNLPEDGVNLVSIGSQECVGARSMITIRARHRPDDPTPLARLYRSTSVVTKEGQQ